VLALACTPAEPKTHPTPDFPTCPELSERLAVGSHFDRSNILVILTDDIGLDQTAAWYEHPSAPATPTLSALACAGMRFDRAYSQPTCSPSRATFLTGRLPSRYGIGRWLSDTGRWGLPLDEITLPELLSDAGYSAGLAGKWHLGAATDPEAARHPLDQGFAYHRGSFSNLTFAFGTGHTPRTYWDWERLEDGEAAWTDTYNITATTDDALELVDLLPEPFFLYVAYNSAHEPLHRPPNRLLLDPSAVSADSEDLVLYQAMVTATDLEIGRLLDGIDDDILQDTLVVYLSDNGSPRWGITAPLDPNRGKGTAYEGGVHVPFIAAGPGVSTAGSRSDALVHFADLFPTFAELADIDLSTWLPADGSRDLPLALDGESLVGVLTDPTTPTHRSFVMSSAFHPAGEPPYSWTRRTVVADHWKYVLLEGEESTLDPDELVREELFEMVETDPEVDAWTLYEGLDLLNQGELSAEAQAALEELSRAMDRELAARPFEY